MAQDRLDRSHFKDQWKKDLGQGIIDFRAVADAVKKHKIVFQTGSRTKLYGNATVTICHSRTKDLPAVVRAADIVVAAVGRPKMVGGDWIKPGAVVIDVGVNRVGEKVSEKTGKKVAILKGDVDFDAAKEIAGWITPVPGGVGPMTITMLMKNTLKSLKFRLGIA